jgi:hypothetical protein
VLLDGRVAADHPQLATLRSNLDELRRPARHGATPTSDGPPWNTLEPGKRCFAPRPVPPHRRRADGIGTRPAERGPLAALSHHSEGRRRCAGCVSTTARRRRNPSVRRAPPRRSRGGFLSPQPAHGRHANAPFPVRAAQSRVVRASGHAAAAVSSNGTSDRRGRSVHIRGVGHSVEVGRHARRRPS